MLLEFYFRLKIKPKRSTESSGAQFWHWWWQGFEFCMGHAIWTMLFLWNRHRKEKACHSALAGVVGSKPAAVSGGGLLLVARRASTDHKSYQTHGRREEERLAFWVWDARGRCALLLVAPGGACSRATVHVHTRWTIGVLRLIIERASAGSGSVR
jgi:hypothetical protein